MLKAKPIHGIAGTREMPGQTEVGRKHRLRPGRKGAKRGAEDKATCERHLREGALIPVVHIGAREVQNVICQTRGDGCV